MKSFKVLNFFKWCDGNKIRKSMFEKFRLDRYIIEVNCENDS